MREQRLYCFCIDIIVIYIVELFGEDAVAYICIFIQLIPDKIVGKGFFKWNMADNSLVLFASSFCSIASYFCSFVLSVEKFCPRHELFMTWYGLTSSRNNVGNVIFWMEKKQASPIYCCEHKFFQHMLQNAIKGCKSLYILPQKGFFPVIYEDHNENSSCLLMYED